MSNNEKSISKKQWMVLLMATSWKAHPHNVQVCSFHTIPKATT